MEGIVFIDYSSRITDKKITEEGRKHLQELQEWMREFMKEHDIHVVTQEGKRII